MQYQTLGNSDLKISTLSFGAMSLGTDQKQNDLLIHRALDLGINFFDTADLYQKGFNETSLGKAIKGKRDQVIIATKVGNQWREDGSGWDWNPSKTYIKESVHKSLKRLQTNYIDLYQLHGGTIDDPIDETIEAFEELQQAGHIRHYGISSIRPNVIRTYILRSNIASVMIQYSLLDRRPEEHCLDLLHKNNISVLVRGGLAKGLLVNKKAKDYLNHSSIFVKQTQDLVRSVSLPERSSAQTALRFILKHPAVTSVVNGIRTMEQLEENTATINTPVLSELEYEELFLSAVNLYEKHR